MNCATFKELAGLLALGGLDAAEREAAERHLGEATHDGCLEALAQAMKGVAAIDAGAPSPPLGAHVWKGIQERLTPSLDALRKARRRTQLAWGVAAMATAAAVLLLVWSPGRDRAERELASAQKRQAESEAQLTAATQDREACRARAKLLEDQQRLQREAVSLLELAGTRLHPLPAEKGQSATANVIIHTGLKRAYVVADGLKPEPNRDYELWLAKGKRVVPAGLMHVDADGRAVVRVDYAVLLGEVGAPDAMMITREPRGGSVGAPGPTVVIGTTGG